MSKMARPEHRDIRKNLTFSTARWLDTFIMWKQAGTEHGQGIDCSHPVAATAIVLAQLNYKPCIHLPPEHLL